MALLKLLSLLTLLFVVYCSASDGATASPAGMTSSGNHAFKPRPRQPLGSAYGVDGSSMSTVYVHNLTYTLSLPRALAFDTVSAVAAVQGIVNRDRPVLYVLYNDIDATWLEYCRRNWLTNASIVQLNTVEDVVAQFRASLAGAVVYDPLVHSTSNVASTGAGVLDAVPMCFQPMVPSSLYHRLVATGPKLPVLENLAGRFNGSISGSAKCDAYLWAIDEYIVTGKCDATVQAYYVDAFWSSTSTNDDYHLNTASNHDYFVAKRGFFWDLSPWADEAPIDDPTQPLGTDLTTLQAILLAAYNQRNGSSTTMIGGFVPWMFKYVNAKHAGVATEWQMSVVISAYNAYVSADACCFNSMANAAFYQHYPLKERYVQNPAPTPTELQSAGFLSATGAVTPNYYYAFYAGDYDSAAWLYQKMLGFWNETWRGQIPIGWAPDPNLSARFPIMLDYMLNTLTPNDRLTTGDSGGGYLNPTQLFEPRQYSGLPSANDVWVSHNVPLYQKFDMTFTGFIINGAAGHMSAEAQAMYTSFSWDGMTDQTGYLPGGGTAPYFSGDTPVFTEIDISGSPQEAAKSIIAQCTAFKGTAAQYQVFRSVLQSAQWHVQVSQLVAEGCKAAKVVDPLWMSYLARAQHGKSNSDRVVYISDTLPRAVQGGQSYNVSFIVRNNGWNQLLTGPATPSSHRVSLRFNVGALASGVALAASDTPVGGTAEFVATARIGSVSSTEPVSFVYGLWRGSSPDSGSFAAVGNPAYTVQITAT